MKLVVESDGTVEGTSVDFHMTAGEIPALLTRLQRRRARRAKKLRPPNVISALGGTQANRVQWEVS